MGCPKLTYNPVLSVVKNRSTRELTSKKSVQNLRSVYIYSFQGQEHDDEVKGKGNSINYKYRMHDPRIGRFFAVDPLAPKYPWYTPYQFSGNKVIDHVELEGLEESDDIMGGNPYRVDVADESGYSGYILYNSPGMDHQAANPLWLVHIPDGATVFKQKVYQEKENGLSPVGIKSYVSAFEVNGVMYQWDAEKEWYASENGDEWDNPWNLDVFNAGMSHVAGPLSITIGDGIPNLLKEAKKDGSTVGWYMFKSAILSQAKVAQDVWAGGHRRSQALLGVWMSSTQSAGGTIAMNLSLKAAYGSTRRLITSADDITPDLIRSIMKDAPLSTRQSGVSLPMVKDYFRKLQNGEVAPAIKVSDGVIIEGNHRYVAGVLFGRPPEVAPGTPSRSWSLMELKSWDKVNVDLLDWRE